MSIRHKQSAFGKIIILFRLSYKLTIARVQTSHTHMPHGYLQCHFTRSIDLFLDHSLRSTTSFESSQLIDDQYLFTHVELHHLLDIIRHAHFPTELLRNSRPRKYMHSSSVP